MKDENHDKEERLDYPYIGIGDYPVPMYTYNNQTLSEEEIERIIRL